MSPPKRYSQHAFACSSCLPRLALRKDSLLVGKDTLHRMSLIVS
jgi:hypothetical protein